MRRLMLLLGLLAAMMLVASPVFAHQGGPHHGNKYSKNYYPNTYFKYCEPDGAKFYGETEANTRCAQYYSEYHKKWYKGKKYYYVHVYYKRRSLDDNVHLQDYWYYCQYHKYNDPNDTRILNFKAWVGYKPTGKHYWESYTNLVE